MKEKMMEEELRKQYRRLTQQLIEKKLTITSMESCTSGQIISMITDTEGASAVVKGAYVTYSNEAKVQLGVPQEILDTYSVYSKETAQAMASTCRNAFQADIGLGITGTFGNVDPANPDASEVGCVYFAIDWNGQVTTYERKLEVQNSRYEYKMAIAQEIVEELLTFVG